MTIALSGLAALEQELRQPFAPEDVKFLPKSPRKNERGTWVCLALPYADKRTYEDRLNQVAFEQWSTPYTPPIVAGNKLVIPVTVVICGVARTDYGEAFLSSLNRQGAIREEENSATEGYSQAFRRACAQFELGRYLDDLPKRWLPYDPNARAIALSPDLKRAEVKKLYQAAGLLSSREPDLQPSVGQQAAQSQQLSILPPATLARPLTVQWICRQLRNDAEKLHNICYYYQVETLEQLTEAQLVGVINHLFKLQAKNQRNPSQAQRDASREQVATPV